MGKAGGIIGFAAENVLADLVEAHSDSGLAMSLGYVAEAEEFFDDALANVPSTLVAKMGRGISNIVTLGIDGREGVIDLWEKEEMALKNDGPSIGAAPSWYQRSVWQWPRMLWKNQFGLKYMFCE